ncbi:MAG: creatininase family protein [Acidobacteria bacterium]|nr:MAG: creatininase family protein [Acidobacteriota bacterium]
MLLYDLTSPQVSDLDRGIVVVVPFGSIEQHSLHLPLGTDSIIGEAIARRLEQALPSQVLLLPMMWLGCSRHHMDFAGSLTAEIETFIDIGEQLVSSMAEHGFRNFILLNSHGGNINKVSLVAEKLRYKLGPSSKVVGVTYWHLVGEEIQSIRDTPVGGMGHSGELETSVMLVVRPELVRKDLIDPDGPGKLSKFEGRDMFAPGKVSIAKPFKEMTRHGGIGDPRKASREKGERILSVIVKKLAEVVEEIQTGKL